MSLFRRPFPPFDPPPPPTHTHTHTHTHTRTHARTHTHTHAFLIRRLVVGFEKEGKPPKTTHHLIEVNEEGLFVINKRVFGSGTNNLIELITELGTGDVAAWPVPLTKPVPVTQAYKPSFVLPGAVASVTTARSVTPTQTPPKRRESGDEESYAPATAMEQRGASLRRSTAERCPWLHGEITRSEAEDLILGADSNGQLVDGTWLVRMRSPFDPARPEYVASPSLFSSWCAANHSTHHTCAARIRSHCLLLLMFTTMPILRFQSLTCMHGACIDS
jgi:hypothetical protein